MNHRIGLSLRESLVDQLVFLDENTTEIIDSYFAADRTKYKLFYNRYMTEVVEFLEGLKAEVGEKIEITKVFIGCRVLLTYVEDNEMVEYNICFPEYSDPENGLISFLSPVGSQLLLRSANEEMLLTTPGADYKVLIKEITFE